MYTSPCKTRRTRIQSVFIRHAFAVRISTGRRIWQAPLIPSLGSESGRIFTYASHQSTHSAHSSDRMLRLGAIRKMGAIRIAPIWILSEVDRIRSTSP